MKKLEFKEFAFETKKQALAKIHRLKGGTHFTLKQARGEGGRFIKGWVVTVCTVCKF